MKKNKSEKESRQCVCVRISGLQRYHLGKLHWKKGHLTKYLKEGARQIISGRTFQSMGTVARAPTQDCLSAVAQVQFSLSVVSDSLQHARPPCPSPAPRVYSASCPLSPWCHPTVSSTVVPFSLSQRPFLLPFQMSQFFTSGGQSIRVSASTSVLPMNIQDWFPLGWTGWMSLQSNGLSWVFSNTTVQKHQFFGAQLSL